MPSYHPDFQAFSPLRLPTWRYDRASHLAEHQPRALRPSRRYDDEFTKKYYQFLLKWHNASGDEGRFNLWYEDADLFHAHSIYHFPDPEWRMLIESRILAGQTDEEIAAKIASTPGTVAMYEALFFNVRQRLTATDYIVKVVLGASGSRQSTGPNGSLTDEHRALVYKLFAWKGGPKVLEVMISGLSEREIPTTADEISEWMDDSMETLLKRKAAIAARTFEVNKYNVISLLTIAVQMVESKRQLKASSGPKSSYEKNVEKFLAGIEWSSGDEMETGHNSKQKLFARTAIEPRAIEMNDLASGILPESLQEDANVQLRLTAGVAQQ